MQTFLAYRDGEVCGRIAGILNQGHNDRYHEHRGFFGFFDCLDDQEAADGLFDAVRQWFADQGIFRLRGPSNPSLNYETGLLVDGFDSPPAFMMTYNPPYYGGCWRTTASARRRTCTPSGGTSTCCRRFAKSCADQRADPRAVQRPRAVDGRLAVRRGGRDVPRRSTTVRWGTPGDSCPCRRAKSSDMAEGLRHLIVPELAVAVEVDGKVVGVAFALPDYNPRIRQINGRLFPFGFFRLLRNEEPDQAASADFDQRFAGVSAAWAGRWCC